MHKDDFILGCHLLGIYPKKYDQDGWRRVLGSLALMGIDAGEIEENIDSLPKSKKDIETAAGETKRRLGTHNTYSIAIGIDADKYVKMSEDKKDKEWEAFIMKVETMDFPPYVLEIDPAVQAVIVENFRYMYSTDGQAIVYCRAHGEQGTVWEEAPDSEHVFYKLKGELRSKVINALVIRSLAKTVSVFINKDNKPHVYEHIPYWKLHKKYMESTMQHVAGSAENVAIIKEKLEEYIETLKRCYDGKLTHCELARGMQEIPKLLMALDENIDSMTFFYQQKINFPMLTNDPNEPALAYFDLSTISEGPTPDFDGFMMAVEPACRNALMAAIFATFFAKCRLNQYIWIHGEGGDGKSSLLNAISSYAGDRLACSLGQTMNSDFGLEDAIGKRMVILSDVKTGLSVKSQLIHNLTGHDPVSVNRKNKPIITVRLNPIVWIAANEAPDVNFDNRNEARRCLYIKMCEPPVEIQKKFYFTDENGNFILDKEGRKQNNGYDLEGGLLKEMPHILYKCREAFEKVCPAPYSVIKPEMSALQLAEDNCVDLEAATYSTYIVETFSFEAKNAQMLQTEIFEAILETMKNHGDRNNLNQFVKHDIRRLLTVKYGCKRKKINGIYYMTGISRKVNGFSPIPNPDTGRPVYMPPQLDIKLPEDNTEFL